MAFNIAQSNPFTNAHTKYNDARRDAQQTVRYAKSSWIKGNCDSINFGFGSGTGGKDAWDTVKLLKAGLAPTRRPPPAKMRREDGSITPTSADGVEVCAKRFHQLYCRIPTFDPNILELLPQAPPIPVIDDLPTDDEIAKSVSRLHATSPGASGTHARPWQALASTPESFNYIKHFILQFWDTKNPPKEWETGLLAILQKGGSK